MRNYFDKDFFRFLLGFIAILCTSIIVLMFSKLYQDESLIGKNTNQTINN